ncbi:MAG: dihydroneopterin aldolase, partial [Leucobacter sp.]|nr:dihydroneopterin aldolase [Leucobacter sp.]
EAAVRAGAQYINDVSGGLHDPKLYEVAARLGRERGASLIIGHWRGVPDPGHGRSDYRDVVAEVRQTLDSLARAAVRHGVEPARIVLDPGLGFDKTTDQGWQVLAHLDQLTSLGYPVLIGVSRKRMLAETLDTVIADGPTMHDRDVATAAVSVLAARAGAWGVRVHDVRSTVTALAVAAAIETNGPAGVDGSPHARVGSSGAASLAQVGSSGGASVADTATSAHAVPDRITLTGLEVFAHHGVFAHEREHGQRFIIDASVAVDLSAAAAGDDLAATVNYAELAGAILVAAEKDPVDLIETLAQRLATVALQFAAVRDVTITVHKPDAPIDAVFDDVSVTIHRTRQHPGRLPRVVAHAQHVQQAQHAQDAQRQGDA